MRVARGEFTTIKGRFSEARVLPRLGKIRLGVKRQTANGKQYPSETQHFVSPPEVEAVYGPEAVELDVILPNDDPGIVFPQKLAEYGSGSGLRCHGNGEQAKRLNDQTKQWEPCVCPCPRLKSAQNPKGTCTEKSDLMVILPMVSMGGCYQIKTSSFHSTMNINSSLDMVRAMTGRISMLPMKLRRVPQETHHDGRKQTHYVLNLILNATWQQVVDLRSNPDSLLIPAQYRIEPPIDENPELDPVDIIDPAEPAQGIEAAELAEMSDAQMAEIQAKMNAARPAETPKVEEKQPEPKREEAPKQAEAQKQAEPPKAEPPKSGQSPWRGKKWTDAQWTDIAGYFEQDPVLAGIRGQALESMKYTKPVAALNELGRQVFMHRAHEIAARGGLTLEVR